MITNNGASQAPNRNKLRKLAVSLAVGAVVGFLGASAVLHFADRGVLGQAGPSVEVALLVATLYGATGFMIAVGTLSPATGAKFLNVEAPHGLPRSGGDRVSPHRARRRRVGRARASRLYRRPASA